MFEICDKYNYHFPTVDKRTMNHHLNQILKKLSESVPEDNLAIQAAYSIFEDDNTRQREVNALAKFEQYKPGNRRIIITNDETDVIKDEYGTIEVIPLWKWSLDVNLQLK